MLCLAIICQKSGFYLILVCVPSAVNICAALISIADSSALADLLGLFFLAHPVHNKDEFAVVQNLA